MSNLERCFEKHSFMELNSIDINNFITIFNKYFSLINSGDNITFFDVGCNAGSFIKVLNAYNIKNNIHCFEPHPILAKTVKDIYPHITMNEICLSNYNGETKINIPMWSVGISSIIKRPVFDTLGQDITVLNVECKTLDKYCQENNIDKIDFIKIDVEGAEKMVFEGARNLLLSKKIKCGIFEVGQTLIDAGTSTEELCKLIESYGYKLDKTTLNGDVFFYL